MRHTAGGTLGLSLPHSGANSAGKPPKASQAKRS
jgi:hypothetical protein